LTKSDLSTDKKPVEYSTKIKDDYITSDEIISLRTSCFEEK